MSIAVIIAASAAIGWGMHAEFRLCSIYHAKGFVAGEKQQRRVRIGLAGGEEHGRASRPVLLGSRNPSGPNRVTTFDPSSDRGMLPTTTGDVDGGPGTRLTTLYCLDRRDIGSATGDFVWHQGRLKLYLENEALLNRQAAEAARQLAAEARRFYETVAACTDWPQGLAAVGFSAESDWPGYCLTELDRAVGRKDLAAVQRWAGELATATFSLDDLHRWLGFLVENQLAALEFQGRCKTLFGLVDARRTPYNPEKTISQLPAGILCANGKENYYEVERQAERLFSMPPDRMRELRRTSI